MVLDAGKKWFEWTELSGLLEFFGLAWIMV